MSAFVNTENTNHRPNQAYSNVINKIKDDGVCPFCPEQLKNYHKNPILIDRKFWLATDNMYPYKGTKQHILLIHKDHIASVSEMSSEAWAELQEIINEAIAMRDIKGGTTFMRFGDTKYTGASVTHLHAHIVTGDPSEPGYEPILTRIA